MFCSEYKVQVYSTVTELFVYTASTIYESANDLNEHRLKVNARHTQRNQCTGYCYAALLFRCSSDISILAELFTKHRPKKCKKQNKTKKKNGDNRWNQLLLFSLLLKD